MKNSSISQVTLPAVSRRRFVQACAQGAATLALLPMLGCRTSTGKKTLARSGPGSRTMELAQDWLFGGKLDPAALSPTFDDSQFAKVTLPHCATKLSWQNWDWHTWQEVFCYRRHFALPATFKGHRVFLDFDGVMVGAEPTINGHALPKHLGGYVPFNYEITDFVK